MLKTAYNAVTSGLKNASDWLTDVFSTRETHSGVRVSVRSALGYPPLFYAVSKIAGGIGQMPLIVRQRMERGSQTAPRHPAYRLLKTRPNKYMTAIGFKETMMAHALLMRSGRAAIIRDPLGRPVELLLLMPDRTCTVYHEGEKWHVTSIHTHEPLDERLDENTSRVNYKIRDEDVLHIPGLSWNGIDGLSIIDIARETIGLGLAGQKATGRNFKNNARPGVVIEAPVGMFPDPEDAKEFLDDFNEAHAGLDEAGKAGLLREGMKLQTMPVSARDAEWLDQRKFERQDTALLFLLESILGDDSSVSFNSLEQKNLAYLSSCLGRWMVKWEQECDEKLLTERQKRQDSHFVKFNEKALLRTDAKTQMVTLTGYIKNRVINPNEARELLDRLPYEGGDEFVNPAITPGDQAETGEDPDTRERDMLRAALEDRFGRLASIEIRRVSDAAGSAKNYLDFLDEFYAGWQTRLSEALEGVGADGSLAVEHCERSKTELLDLTDTVTLDELPTAVAELTAGWSDRVGKLVDTLMRGSEVDACV